MVTQQHPRRIPLVKFFAIALSIILSLFLLVSWLTFSRLLNFESILNNISDRALPEIVLSSELYGETSKLLEFTNLLSNSTSDAGKRLAEQQLNSYIRNIKNLSDRKLDNEFLDTQLDIINIELLEFSNLIWKRSNIRKQLKISKESVYSAFLEIFKLPYEQNSFEQNIIKDKEWRVHLPRLMILTGQALSTQKLQIARGHFNDFKLRTATLKNILGDSSVANQKKILIDRLEYLVFAENGLESLVISQLKIDGRVKGRENFLHHLIDGFSDLLGISANETKKNVFNQVSISVKTTKEQTNLIGVTIGIAIILLFAVLFFIQQKILKRLQHINLMVRSKTEGTEYEDLLKGNDEITDLAKTFNEFINTIDMQKQKLEQMSLTDPLTEIANRRALDIRLQHDLELSIRQKSSVSVLLMDIDCFKLYNDNYGHTAGDKCLKLIAKVISNTLHRDGDFISRFGGEEFLCVLPNTDIQSAEKIALKICQNLEDEKLPHKFSNVSDFVTVSIGIAMSSPTQILQAETIIKQADTALYWAKDAGKNTYKTFK